MKCDMCDNEAEVVIDFLNIKSPIGEHHYCFKHFDVYVFSRNLGREVKESLERKCETCGNDKGKPRVDNGLACGTHCNDCFEKMVSDCRSRSW